MTRFRHSDKTKLTAHANDRARCHGLLTAVGLGVPCFLHARACELSLLTLQHFPRRWSDWPHGQNIAANAFKGVKIPEYFCIRRMNYFCISASGLACNASHNFVHPNGTAKSWNPSLHKRQQVQSFNQTDKRFLANFKSEIVHLLSLTQRNICFTGFRKLIAILVFLSESFRCEKLQRKKRAEI